MPAEDIERVDAVIIGGGPAGASVARQLARRGHRVVLLTRPPSHNIAVSLPPSSRKVFAEFGIQAEIDAAGFYRSRGNTVWWGDSPARSEAFADGTTGYQVRRRELEQVLIELARGSGARVERSPPPRSATAR